MVNDGKIRWITVTTTTSCCVLLSAAVAAVAYDRLRYSLDPAECAECVMSSDKAPLPFGDSPQLSPLGAAFSSPL